jgi:putative endonuclease
MAGPVPAIHSNARQTPRKIAGSTSPDYDRPSTGRYMMCKRGYVYFMASRKHGTLYVGVTSNLTLRVDQHKQGTASAFTRHYKVNRLVYFEEHELITDAVQRESNIKHWPRAWKVRLIEAVNPEWDDLTNGMWME